jgi:hypothetical protein
LTSVVFPDAGAGTALPVSGAGFCVVALDSFGLYRWSQCPDGVSQVISTFDMAVDDRGNIVVAGGFSGRIGFASGPFDSGPREFLSTPNFSDVVVAKLDSSGALLWQKQFGGDGSQSVTLGLARARDDAIVLAGSSSGTLDFGDGSVPLVSDSSTAFLAELDGEGRHVWSRLLGPSATARARRGLLLDSSRGCDTLYFAADYSGSFDAAPGNEGEIVDGILVGEFFR